MHQERKSPSPPLRLVSKTQKACMSCALRAFFGAFMQALCCCDLHNSDGHGLRRPSVWRVAAPTAVSPVESENFSTLLLGCCPARSCCRLKQSSLFLWPNPSVYPCCSLQRSRLRLIELLNEGGERVKNRTAMENVVGELEQVGCKLSHLSSAS